MASSTARRKPSRAARSSTSAERLTVEQIVAAALRLTKRHGLANLSMRTLADELGVTPMAAYYHVRNKTEPGALVLGAVMPEVKVPAPSPGTWPERRWKLNRHTPKATASHPGLAEALLDRPPTPAGQAHIRAT